MWGSEDDAELLRKHENWKRARAKQIETYQRQLSWRDIAKLSVIGLAFRQLVHKLGFSVRKVSLTLFIVAFLRGLYKLRAPAQLFPKSEEYPSYPILGQIGIARGVLSKGGAIFQVQRARSLGFTSNEFVLFANVRETSLMDPRDREYMLKTNWKNILKNDPNGAGFQENFAEIMGRGIFAVVS